MAKNIEAADVVSAISGWYKDDEDKRGVFFVSYENSEVGTKVRTNTAGIPLLLIYILFQAASDDAAVKDIIVDAAEALKDEKKATVLKLTASFAAMANGKSNAGDSLFDKIKSALGI